MAIMSVFKTSTSSSSPLDGSAGHAPRTRSLEGGGGGGGGEAQVSDFLTVQSFTNFAAMTGAITAAWNALQRFSAIDQKMIWVPYGMALAWGLISFLISLPGLKGDDGYEAGTVLGALFVAFINSLVLAGAVVGTDIATSPQGG